MCRGLSLSLHPRNTFKLKMSSNDRLNESTRECFRSAIIEETASDRPNVVMLMAPEKEKTSDLGIKVFLAGTIDGGASENWQRKFYEELKKRCHDTVTVFNPRRDDWPDDGSDEVRNQIRWEHEHMDKADIIVMNLLPDSKSPISLMEIGMFADSGKLMVFCQEDFYRYDNVDMVCDRYDIPLYLTNDIDKMVGSFLHRVEEMGYRRKKRK